MRQSPPKYRTKNISFARFPDLSQLIVEFIKVLVISTLFWRRGHSENWTLASTPGGPRRSTPTTNNTASGPNENNLHIYRMEKTCKHTILDYNWTLYMWITQILPKEKSQFHLLSVCLKICWSSLVSVGHRTDRQALGRTNSRNPQFSRLWFRRTPSWLELPSWLRDPLMTVNNLHLSVTTLHENDAWGSDLGNFVLGWNMIWTFKQRGIIIELDSILQ